MAKDKPKKKQQSAGKSPDGPETAAAGNGEAASPANGEALSPANGEALSPVNGEALSPVSRTNGPETAEPEERSHPAAPTWMGLVTEPEEQQSPALLYPVVGFGASAGGLQAFREILENLDSNTGMAFVLVTHLAPDQRSFMSEIVERYTQMPVVSISDGQRPLQNHLYVLQPNQALTLREGVFQVDTRPATERVPRTIDRFFHSLASDQKNHAIGVVLSGADADGALGLKAIKGEGGIALVQSPDTAQHSGMPRSSIASDHVDLVLPPAEIAIELGRLAHQFTRPEVRSLEEGVVAPNDEQSFGKILQLLRGVSGLDLRQYKPETIRRRIARRMILLRMEQRRVANPAGGRADQRHALLPRSGFLGIPAHQHAAGSLPGSPD
jgi:chemotaxis response regulator CheB